MNRRAFIGSLLGTVAGVALAPRLDFFAATESAEWQRVALPYRMLFHDRCSGLLLQAPGIVEASLIGHKLRVKCEPLTAEQNLSIDRFILMDHRGRVLDDQTQHPFFLLPGDSLEVTHYLSFWDEWDEGSRSCTEEGLYRHLDFAEVERLVEQRRIAEARTLVRA